jgi:hypothetical protein
VKDTGKLGHEGRGRVKVMNKLLDGGYGFDAKFALAPPIGPSAEPSDSNHKGWENFIIQERFRQWGKEQAFLNNRQRLPPTKLWRSVSPIEINTVFLKINQ